MELRHLRYFVAVAEEQNVSRAAKRLHISQPPLSRQIRDLENDLGIALFEHSAKAIRLTPAGRIFLSEARAVLQRADDAVAFTKAVAHRKRTRIRVGYSFYAATGFLPRALLAFQRTNPEVSVDLSTKPTQDMLRGLRSGSLDVALLRYASPENFQGLSVEELGTYPFRVASHKKHRFARLREVPMSEVARQPIVAFSRREYPDYHVLLARLLSPYNPSLNIVEEYESVPSIIAAVEAGRGISIVNQSMSHIAGERIVLRPLKPAPEPARYVLAYRKEGVSPSITSFLKAARTSKLR